MTEPTHPNGPALEAAAAYRQERTAHLIAFNELARDNKFTRLFLDHYNTCAATRAVHQAIEQDFRSLLQLLGQLTERMNNIEQRMNNLEDWPIEPTPPTPEEQQQLTLDGLEPQPMFHGETSVTHQTL